MISVTQMSDCHILRVCFLFCYVFILKTVVSSIICLSVLVRPFKGKREFCLNVGNTTYLQPISKNRQIHMIMTSDPAKTVLLLRLPRTSIILMAQLLNSHAVKYFHIFSSYIMLVLSIYESGRLYFPFRFASKL